MLGRSKAGAVSYTHLWGGHVDEPMPTAVPDPDKPARMASRQARLSEQDSLQQDDGK